MFIFDLLLIRSRILLLFVERVTRRNFTFFFVINSNRKRFQKKRNQISHKYRKISKFFIKTSFNEVFHLLNYFRSIVVDKNWKFLQHSSFEFLRKQMLWKIFDFVTSTILTFFNQKSWRIRRHYRSSKIKFICIKLLFINQRRKIEKRSKTTKKICRFEKQKSSRKWFKKNSFDSISSLEVRLSKRDEKISSNHSKILREISTKK